MKKILLVFISIMCLLMLSGCNDLSNNDNKTSNKDSTSKESTNIETYYKDNESINLFINKYNSLNDSDITSNMISKKHIGGRDRDDVVTISNDKLEINIYENYKLRDEINMSVYVGYKPKIEKENDDFKVQFINYIKIFDDTLSDDEILNYWNDMISEYKSGYKIKEIDITPNVINGKVEYFKITAKINL